MEELLFILFIGGLVWLWRDTVGAKEVARQSAGLACQRNGLQLLDDTVALGRLGLVRNAHGRLILRRTYRFEFNFQADPSARREGVVEVAGRQVTRVELDPPVSVQ